MFRSVRRVERYVTRQSYMPALVPIRQFWVPLIVAGAAFVIGSTVLKGVVGAMEKSKAREAAREHYEKSQTNSAAGESQPAASSETSESTSAFGDGAGKRGASVPREALKPIRYHPYCIGVDVGSCNSKAVLKYWSDHSNNSSGSWIETTRLIENAEGGRMTPTALFISSENDDFVVGEFAKVKRFTRPSNARVGLRATLAEADTNLMHQFASECARVLPMHFHDVPGPIFTQNSPSTVLSSVLAVHLTKSALYKLAVEGMPGMPGRGDDSVEVDPEHLCINIGVSNGSTGKHNSSIAALTRRLLGKDAVGVLVNTVPDALCSVRGAESLGLMATTTDCASAGAGAVEPIKDGEFVLVVDVGGACTQLSLLQWGQDTVSVPDWKTTRRVGAPVRVLERTLGGGCEAIDKLLIEDLAGTFARETGIDLLQDPLAKQRLSAAAEQARTELCTRAKTTISLPFITADSSGPKHLERTVSRSTLDKLCCDVLEPVHRDLDKLLEDFEVLQRLPVPEAEMTHDSQVISLPKAVSGEGGLPPVHTVILTGGGIRMPYVAADLAKQLAFKVDAANGSSARPVHVVVPEYPEELNCIGVSSVLSYH